MQEISDMGAMARSILHKKVRQVRASASQTSQYTVANGSQHKATANSQQTEVGNGRELSTATVAAADDSELLPIAPKATYTADTARQSTQGIIL